MSVCLSVPSVTSCLDQSIFIILAQINKQTCLEQSIFIFLGQRAIREQSKHPETAQRALREHSKVFISESYPSEPKILRLVFIRHC